MTDKKVLIVDDDEEMCEELASILCDAGYTVSTAYNGLAGSKLALNEDYGVILLDMKMPGMEGYDVLKRVKKAKPQTKVVVLTGRHIARKSRMEEGLFITDDDERKTNILKLADCVMNKPFDAEKVLMKVTELASNP